MNVDYDDDADVLYVTLKDAERPSRFEENEEGQILRIDPSTSEVIGITIPMFSRRARESEDLAGPFARSPELEHLIDLVIAGHGRPFNPEEWARQVAETVDLNPDRRTPQ